jgi:hypothetical protein
VKTAEQHVEKYKDFQEVEHVNINTSHRNDNLEADA